MSLRVESTLDLSRFAGALSGVLERGDQIAMRMRVGAPGSVLDQFVRQGTMDERGYTPWKPAQRVLRHGGRTLVDTGAYFGGWMGAGGSITEIAVEPETLRVAIGVELAEFPQAEVFQADDVTRFREREMVGEAFGFEVEPRRLSISRELLQDIAERLFAGLGVAA